MTLCQYAKSKGMKLNEYQNLKENIKNIAKALIMQIPPRHKGNGMYYPISEILPYNTNADLKPYILQEMKSQGLETFDNETLYRY